MAKQQQLKLEKRVKVSAHTRRKVPTPPRDTRGRFKKKPKKS